MASLPGFFRSDDFADVAAYVLTTFDIFCCTNTCMKLANHRDENSGRHTPATTVFCWENLKVDFLSLAHNTIRAPVTTPALLVTFIDWLPRLQHVSPQTPFSLSNNMIGIELRTM